VTVVLFVLAIFLVFAGTLAQIDLSNVAAVAKYFRSFYVWIPFQIFFTRDPKHPIWGGFPFPGGWTIGVALLVNLLAAHAVRFKLTWKRSGILILHAGLVLMMVGELVTGLFAVETRMTIVEGQDCNFVENFDKDELAFATPSKANPKVDDVIAIPATRLRTGGTIHDDRLPVDIVVEKYMRNSDQVDVPPPDGKNPVTAGEGLKTYVIEKGETSGVESEQSVNIPSAYVTFKDKKTGESLGTYLVSVYLSAFGDAPQKLEVNGTTYEVALRFQRTYKPYNLHLKKFSTDFFPGTEIPTHYSSLVQVTDASAGVDREVDIWMNHPLRYEGDTIYQADFLRGAQRGTVLQVVQNPGWRVPYISCTLVALGMLIHFGLALIGFIQTKILPTLANRPVTKQVNGRRNGSPASPAQPVDWTTVGVCGFILTVALLYLAVAATPPSERGSKFNFEEAGKIAVVDRGRSKPLSSVARNRLMVISGRQTAVEVIDDKGVEREVEHPPMEWMLDVMLSHISKNGKAENYRVFRIENDQVLNLLGLKERSGFRYSFAEVLGKDNVSKLMQEVQRAQAVKESERSLFDTKVLELYGHLTVYQELATLDQPYVLDPKVPGEKPMSLKDAFESDANNPQLIQYVTILEAYVKGDADKFNSAADDYYGEQSRKDPDRMARADYEAWFNSFAPFYQCMILYVAIIVLAALSWLVFHKPLNRAAFWLMLATFLVHTWALISRMYIQERPPVTNLYSSAVFIGWVAVGLLLIIEWFFKYGIATFLGGIIGFATLFIAHFLSLDGDTMEMMRAVLDTNFWLATHVTAVTIGYAATFVAGFIGIVYIALSIYNKYTKSLDQDVIIVVGRYMLYGVICFAMLFSFVGTVLGGIWADQSWGRFWGWDAKENGALMIVIWNALILHARWSGLVKARGTAVLAVFGNIITAWSWFGVNMLGVGLHSYGFMHGALVALLAFIFTQVAIMVVGMIPGLHNWTGGDPKNRFKLSAV
jgi:ABC-type transport system involved in cytochrome c biogenesis permease subunit